MPDPIANFSPEAVIDAIEKNLMNASLALSRYEGSVVFRGSDVTWVYTGYPALSRVLLARFSPDEAEDRVADIAECFRRWKAPVSWIIGPSTWPIELTDYLHDNGFGPGESWLGLAIDLAKLPAADQSLRIHRITEEKDLKTWALLSTEPWPGEAANAAVNLFSPENGGADPNCRFYLGYLNGKPAARGLVYISEGTAGVHWCNAIPEFRDRGLAAALAVGMLAEARTAGLRLGVISISEGTAYQQLGFKPYCQFSVYRWPSLPPKIALC